jgi:MbtH protein
MTDQNSAVPEPEYRVVVNDEEQYSIWPLHKHNAPGWNDVGVSGTKERCLEHIREVWQDLRPRSLREAMEQAR